jgi:hypothetical protein
MTCAPAPGRGRPRKGERSHIFASLDRFFETQSERVAGRLATADCRMRRRLKDLERKREREGPGANEPRPDDAMNHLADEQFEADLETEGTNQAQGLAYDHMTYRKGF